MPTTVADLASELVQCILEAGYYDERMLPDYQTLLSACMVCKAWRHPAQQLLFHTVRLGRIEAPEDVLRFRSAVFSSSRGRALAFHIRQADIVLGNWAYCGNAEDLVNLVEHCPRLYDVTLRVMGVHELGEATMEALRRAHAASFPTPIRSLSLLVCGVQSPILYQLLSIWHTIQFLRVGAELVAVPPTGPAQMHLYELLLHRTPSPQIVEWLVASSSKSLRIFHCHVAPSADYDRLLTRVGENILSLRFLRHTKRSAALIQHCPNLRELLIIQLSSFLPLGELPLTLEHLSFRSLSLVAMIPLYPIISAVDKLPKLRLITCDACTEQNVDFSALQSKCQKRGIVIFSGLLPIPMSEDPVPSQTYPRGKSVLNFPLMNQPIS